MTKAELIEKVAKETGVSQKNVNQLISAFCEVVSDALAKGEKVQLTGFGSFEARQRNARNGKNPKTGETIKIPGHRVPAFKAGKNLKEKVK